MTLLRANQAIKKFPDYVHLTGSSVNLAAADGDAESLVREFSTTAYSGGKLYVDGFPHPVVVDLDGVTVKANGPEQNVLPITLDHKDDERVGHTTDVKVGRQNIVLAGMTSAETPARDEVIRSARSGFSWAASIEGHVRRKQMVKKGQFRVINGQRHEGPFVHAQAFVLRKVSFVTSGGDEDNTVTIAAALGVDSMDPKFEKWLIAKGFDPETVAASESQAGFLKSLWEAETAEDGEKVTAAAAKTVSDAKTVSEDDGEDIVDQRLEAAAKAAEHIAALEEACEGDQKLFARACREKWSPEKAALEFMRQRREEAPAAHIKTPRADNSVLTAALCRSTGMLDEKEWDDEILEASERFPQIGLHGLMHQVLQAAGKYYPVGCYDNEFIRASFEANDLLKANEGFSSISLTGILSNIANKRLLSAYQTVPGVIETISGTLDVSDFKTTTMYRLTGTGKLWKLGADGEIKHTSMGEESYTNKAETYARMLALTRQMIINDDLGAFMQIPQNFGRQAALTLEKTGFETLLTAIDGGTFFTEARGNKVPAAAEETLSIDGLTAAEQLFDEQVDGNTQDGQIGDPILMAGAYLLTPPALKVPARELMNNTTLMVENRNTSSTKATRIGVDNPHNGKYIPVSSPYFGTKHSLTGGSNTHWLIIADPNDAPLIQIARLRGQRAPIMDSAETDFNVLGMQWRVYMDFGFAMQDWRCGVYSDGVNA